MSQLLFLAMKTGSLATILAFVFHMVQSQLNPAFTQNSASSVTGTNIFYFDSASDCNRPIRELYASKATIKGSDPSLTKQGQTTCTIMLQSTGQFDTTVFDIEVISMNIQDCDIQISIYDGAGAQHLMMTYDCRSSQNQNRKRFLTSGNSVTFMMARRNIKSVNFDIEITVSPVRGGIDPSDQNNRGSDYYFDKFPQTAIVGLIGAFYAIIIGVCTVIIFYFSRIYWGMNKQWETHQLATMRTGTTFDKKHPPSSVWSVEVKQKQGLAITDFSMRKNMTPKTVEDCEIVYNDQVFQKHLMSGERGCQTKPRYVSSNASFVDTGADSECFQEKLNDDHSKARKSNKQLLSYNDASDLTSDYSSSNDESDVASIESSEKRQSVISVDKTSRSPKFDTISYAESRTDKGSEDDCSCRAYRTKIKKDKVRHKIKQRKQDVNSFSQPKPSHSQLLPTQAQQVLYNSYPTGHFVPLVTNVPHFKSPPAFSTMSPPTYIEKPSRQVQPTEPPVYSYLVRRGYTPLDVHDSSVDHTLHGQRPVVKQLEGPVLRLESGVEYMRR